MTKSRASLTTKRSGGVKRIRSIIKRSLEWVLIAIGYRPLPRYFYIRDRRLRVDRQKGIVEPNWDNPEVLENMSRNIQALIDSGLGGKSMAKRKSNSKLAEECAVDLQLLVRLKAADQNGKCKCVSCGAVKHWSMMQGGHYQGRSVIATKLMEENIHPQCRRCNLRSSTSHVGYTLYMLDMYGKEFIQELKQMAASNFRWVRKDIEQSHSEIKKQIEYQKKRLGVGNE